MVRLIQMKQLSTILKTNFWSNWSELIIMIRAYKFSYKSPLQHSQVAWPSLGEKLQLQTVFFCLFRISLSRISGGGHITGNFDLERQVELDIKCLQILRAIIHNQILLIDEEDKERNPKEYRKYENTNILCSWDVRVFPHLEILSCMDCLWLWMWQKFKFPANFTLMLTILIHRQCELYLHPVQNEIQDLGNTVARVSFLFVH